jgi:hypothetical protein
MYADGAGGERARRFFGEAEVKISEIKPER